MNKNFKYIVKKIKEYDYIVIARHQNSDMDCLGSQFALKEWINLNYPSKKVYCIGDNHQKYTKNFVPKSDVFDLENEEFLGICVDVNQYARIDECEIFEKASYKICIDHHDCTHKDSFDYAYIDGNIIACAQIIAEFMISSKNKKMNKNICKYLFAGMSTDSGNFYFEACNSNTFKVAGKLMEVGNFNPFIEIHSIIGFDSLEDAKLTNKLFDRIVYDKDSGLAYYINKKEDLKELGVTAHGANEKIGSYNHIEEFRVILSASQDEDDLYRCSIRSKGTNVVETAKKYGGGGHKLACGVKGLNEEKLKALIEDLKKLEKI